jgi:uncharacterized protein YgbK (DUF1537 family)
MIVVIADDLTGAAEIGGIGLNFGLVTEITTQLHCNRSADLLIIATDSRSMPEQQALKITKAACITAATIKPDLLFKKIDSVLRGHVMAEIKLQLNILGTDKALVVPGNPNFGRTLTGGHYYISDQPIHETGFASDPEFAITGSQPHQMLRVNKKAIIVQQANKKLPAAGIVVGETAVHDDLSMWVNKADKDTLLAGGAGLFTALLQSRGYNNIAFDTEIHTTFPALFVCGSAHHKSRELVMQLKQNGGPVSYMPVEIMLRSAEGDFEAWADEIVSLVKKQQRAVIAIDDNGAPGTKITAGQLRENVALIVEKVFQKLNIKELLVEGGSTAAAIINRLNFSRFYPVDTPGAGVIRMRVANSDVLLTLKPGSYDWPPTVWNF